MKGCRPITAIEMEEALKSFEGRYASRDKALFVLGIKSGFRISEILSITIGDVFRDGVFLNRVNVGRRRMKGKTEGRSVILHPDVKAVLSPWVSEILTNGGSEDTFLFKSRNGENRPISRVQAWKILENFFSRIGLTGTLGTHCLRKTFANCVYEKLGRDLVKTQKALGHRNINSTVSYLSFKSEDIDQAILSI